MFERFLQKTVSTDKQLPAQQSNEIKNMEMQLDEMKMRLEDESDEMKALDYYFNTKGSGFSSTNSNGASYSVTDEEIDFRTLQSLYCSEGWFYIVVQAITKAIVSVPLKLEKKKITKEQIQLPNGQMEEVLNETWIEADGEPEFDLFNRPNDFQTSLEFFMLIIIDLLSTGNLYIWIDRGEGGIEVDRPTARLEEAMRKVTIDINGIYRMSAALMEPIVDDEGLGVSSYILTSSAGTMEFQADEILHIKMPNPCNPLLGMAPIVPVMKHLLIDRFTSEHMIRFYKQGARLGGVIKTTKKLTKEQVTRLTRNFEANFSGKNNHHKTLILPEGMTYDIIEANPGETSLIEFSKFNKEPILSAYAVPPIRVGLLDGASYANALIQDKAFWDNGVIPIIRILEDGIAHSGKIIKRERKLRLKWDLSDVDALQENMKEKGETATTLVNTGWSINEIREKHWKMPKLEKGMGGTLIPLVERTRNLSKAQGSGVFNLNAPGVEDEKTQPADAQNDQDTLSDITGTQQNFNERVGELTAINVASGLSPSIAAQEAVVRALEEGLMPGVDPNESTNENNEDPDNDPQDTPPEPTPEDEEEDEEEEDKAPKLLIPGFNNESVESRLKALTGEGVAELIEERFTEVQETFKRMEPLFQDAAKSLTTDKSGRLNKRKHLIKSLRNKAEGDDGLPSDKAIKKFSENEAINNPTAVNEQAMEVGHENTLPSQSLTFNNVEALEFIKANAADKIVGITQTTKDQIRGVIADSFEAQSTPKQLADMISDMFEQIGSKEGRGMTIARTETLTAVSEGAELKKNQLLKDLPDLGKDLMKAWVDADDTKVRPSHEKNDDEGSIPHDEAFSNGLMYPRQAGKAAKEVINCRCAVIYFLKSEQQEIEETLDDFSLLPSII